MAHLCLAADGVASIPLVPSNSCSSPPWVEAEGPVATDGQGTKQPPAQWSCGEGQTRGANRGHYDAGDFGVAKENV